jgi:hypothetical protein
MVGEPWKMGLDDRWSTSDHMRSVLLQRSAIDNENLNALEAMNA